jgi:hypothetical protein
MSPIHKLFHAIRSTVQPNLYKTQSFTFYIPSPPARKVGYREKEFDKIFYTFINSGYQILDFKTQTNSGQQHSGMWVIFIVRSTNSQAAKLNLQDELDGLDFEEEQIEGLYQINDNNEFP